MLLGEVTDIAPGVVGHTVTFVDGAGQERTLAADKILLATGHSRVEARPGTEDSSGSPTSSRGRRTSPSSIPCRRWTASRGAHVAMKGIGLTFIDALFSLTEGRGGVFERMPDSDSRTGPGRSRRRSFPSAGAAADGAEAPATFPSACAP